MTNPMMLMFPSVRRPTVTGGVGGSLQGPGAAAGWTWNPPTSAEGTVSFNTTTGNFDGQVVDHSYPSGLPSTWAGFTTSHLTDSGNAVTNLTNLFAAIGRNKIVTIPANADFDISNASGCVFPDLGAGTNYCYVMSRKMYDGTQALGSWGSRATDTGSVADLARLRVTGGTNLTSAFSFTNGSATTSYYRFWGVKFYASAAATPDTGSGDMMRIFWTQSGVRGSHIQFRQCVVTADVVNRQARNIIANDADFFVFEDGELSNALLTGSESHAYIQLRAHATELRNTHLTMGQVTIMYGGATVGSGQASRDSVIKNCHIQLPQTAPTTSGPNWKNRIEIKFAKRVAIWGNVIDGSWTGEQAGVLLNITNSVDSATNDNPDVQTEDIAIWYNELIRGNKGAQISGWTGSGTTVVRRQQRVSLANNLFHRMRDGLAGSDAEEYCVLLNNASINFEMVKNTFHYVAVCKGAGQLDKQVGQAGLPEFALVTPFIRDNIFIGGSFGWKASGQAEGKVTMDALTQTGARTWTNNTFTDRLGSTNYDDGVAYFNLVAGAPSTMGFADLTAPTTVDDFIVVSGDYAPGGARDSTDGTQMGCTPSRISSRTAGVV